MRRTTGFATQAARPGARSSRPRRLFAPPGPRASWKARLGLWTALCLLTSLPLPAQTTGALRGIVTDDTGAPLTGVLVTVSSRTQSVASRSTMTDGNGAYLLSGLSPADDYRVTAALDGFGAVTQYDIAVSSGKTATLAVVLHAADALRERVEVHARTGIIDLDDASSNTVLSAEFIQALPLLGRNYQDLLTLAPGVSDVNGDGNPNIHGARDTDLMTLVDGVNTTDPLTGKSGMRLNLESIQEVEIKTSGATAEFGRAQGGFANVVTKSGGNTLEGTFKFFWRGSRIDGDGAGIDDPRLHAGVGEMGLRDLRFNDYLPFLAVGGPIVKDRAWFYVANEWIRNQEPVNAVSAAFVRQRTESREFAKLTWQVADNQRLALSVNYDPQEFANEGLNSFTRLESGYTLRDGGVSLTLRDTAILGPMATIETLVSSFDGRPELVPSLDRDTNHNGTLYDDRNHDGVFEASERDPGDDYDQDGVFDVFEDANHNGVLDPGEDRDGDGHLTPVFGCDGATREDADCDGHLDRINEDRDGDGILYTCSCALNEDLDHDGRLDPGTEDRNGNRQLDDTPRPAGVYPYGRTVPLEPDRNYNIGQSVGIVSGPYFKEYGDRRRRVTLRQDLSVYTQGHHGSHDLKGGWIGERESFQRHTEAGEIDSTLDEVCALGLDRRGGSTLGGDDGGSDGTASNVCFPSGPLTVKTLLPSEPFVDNRATSVDTGLYLQDDFKPVPNLSIGLGLRFDRERTESFGFEPFDPALERAPFDRLQALSGAEIGQNDLLVGDNDGLDNLGILGDPIFHGTANVREATAAITDPIRTAAIGRLTRHRDEIGFVSTQLGGLYPDLFVGNELDTRRLLDLGVRIQQPEQFTLTNDNLSPRVSIAWDPQGRGRTKLFATWGRYYDKLFLNSIVGEEGPDYLARYYLFDPTGVAVDYGLVGLASRPVALSAQPDHNIGAFLSKSPPSTTQVDRGLRTPFSDEMTLGFQAELGPQLALSVSYIKRLYRDQLQDIDVNHTLRFDPLTGRPLDLLGQASVLTFGNQIQVPDGRPDLYVLNPFFNQILKVGNFNAARYSGFELQLVRHLWRRWQVEGSYVYSRAVGSAEDFQSRLGNDPSTVESEFGYLDYDQRHVVKIHGMVYLPHDWQVGSSATWASGLPYSIISRFFALDNSGYQQFRTRYGYTAVAPDGKPYFTGLHRNSERNDSTLDLNLNVRRSFVVGRSTAAAFLEVFNVLNRDDLRITTYEPNKGVFHASDVTQLTGPLQIDSQRRFGRRFQFGVQFEF